MGRVYFATNREPDKAADGRCCRLTATVLVTEPLVVGPANPGNPIASRPIAAYHPDGLFQHFERI